MPLKTSRRNQQSPIKLLRSESFHVPFPRRYLDIDYKGGPYRGTFDDKPGHENFVLGPLADRQRPPMISLGGVKAQLTAIHLHTPSEHDLEGKDKDGEIHLVHEIKNPTTASTVIVLGIFFEKRATSKNTDFFSLWTSELKAAKRSHGKSRTEVDIDPRHLLPNSDKWFRYEGSLTSKPHKEVVSWVVFLNPLGIASADLKKLEQEAHQPERPTQDINRRFVLRNFK